MVSVVVRWVRVALLTGAWVVPVASIAATDAKTAEPRPSRAGKVTFVEAPSHESPSAREKRLLRECKGRPNAGMCLGYTR